MNRGQRRDFVKKATAKGLDKSTAKACAEIIDKGSGNNTPPQKFEDGDLVQLNVEAIKKRQNYPRMSESYKQFVDDNVGRVFTVHVERPNLISLKEEPKWLFWSGDLIKQEDSDGES